jgi:hypothetical protein
MNDQALLYDALEFMRRRYPLHQYDQENQLSMVGICTAFLKGKAEISNETAERIAVKALGEYESTLFDSYVDLAESTSHTIIIKGRRDGTSHAFTAAKLLQLMRCHAIPIS